MYFNYLCYFFCPFWPYCYLYYSRNSLRLNDPITNIIDNEISQELEPDLFDIIPETIFEELNPEGIPGVPGIPGESAFPALTPPPRPSGFRN